MANMTNYLENALVDYLLRTNSTAIRPTTVYIALFTSATALTDLGTDGTEVTGGSYARVQVGPGDTAWTATQGGTTGNSTGTGGTTSNAADIVFTQATANWGTIRYIGIMTAITGGNMLMWGQLTVDKTINSGDQFKIAAANLTATFA